MKLSSQQLNRYFAKDYTVDELTSAIEKSGIELEGLIMPEPLNTKIVVGLTKKVVQHPNADKLRLVLVDVGTGQNLHIVCGAPNVIEDVKVAVATVGAILPDGTEIREAKLRGELSQGMLCSEAELGMSDDHDGILVLPEDYQVGKSLCDIEPADTIVDTKSAANRSDLQSYEGIVREIAAQLKVAPLLPKPKDIAAAANTKLVKKLPKHVPAYAATVLEVDSLAKLTFEQLSVLSASGVRSISPVVDVTNYILLTVGQPHHAFDADKVKLPLEVRYAVKGESIETLDGKKRTLGIEDLVIADGNGPVALAGVMGGSGSEVSSSTKSIILESAIFSAGDVRKTAQRHGIRTDASARYERGLPVELLDRGRALAVQMLVDMGAKVISGARLGAVESPAVTIEVKPEKIDTLLGIQTTPKDMIKYLTLLGFDVSGLAKLKVRVPWWRPDMSTSSDVAEEIIKMVGLDSLPATIPAWSPNDIEFDITRAITSRVRELLRASGLFELTTYSFVSEADLDRFGLKPAKHLKLKNPLSVEQAYLRSNLQASLIKVLESNQRYAKNFGVSEISRVFIPGKKKGDLPYEPYKLGIAVIGDYFAVKAPLDLLARELRLNLQFTPSKHETFYPGRQADVMLDDQIIGTVGELHPRLTKEIKGDKAVSYAELNLESILLAADSHVFEPISRFPSISRDIAVVLKNSILWSEVAVVVAGELPGAKIRSQSRYEGKGIPEGHASVAFRITLSSLDRTLTDAEADEAVGRAINALAKKFDAKLRA